MKISVPEAAVGILVDYESPLARRVAGDIWSGLSRAALEAGHTKVTALWESLRENPRVSEEPLIHVFAVGQDRPDAVDAIEGVGDPADPRLYGVVVAVPEECERYARRLLERLRGAQRTA